MMNGTNGKMNRYIGTGGKRGLPEPNRAKHDWLEATNFIPRSRKMYII